MKNALGMAKLGMAPERWFSQSRLEGVLARAFTGYTLAAARSIAQPEHVPISDPSPIAALARRAVGSELPGAPEHPREQRRPDRARRPRRRARSRRHGLPRRRRAADRGEGGRRRSTGSRAIPYYTMGEVGRVGLPCARPEAIDDVHLCRDKLALIQRDHRVADGRTVGALYLTTLVPSCPQLFLNVATDDYAVVTERDCGCPLGEAGLTMHIHSIRSYDKLTSEGMTFLGPEVFALLEDELPRRFGGRAGDYQLVEEEVDGLTKVSLLVSPGVGDVDEAARARERRSRPRHRPAAPVDHGRALAGREHPARGAPGAVRDDCGEDSPAARAAVTDTWESMAGVWLEGQPQRLWRRHSDRVNTDLVQRWLPPVESVLKTDLFDEAVGTGLYPTLAERAGRVVGIDASQQVVEAAKRRYPELEAVRADVRALPLADAELEAVVSNSTLDHFDDAAQIEVALGELARVLRPGGILLLTLDNPLNPIVAVTKALPRQELNRVWSRVGRASARSGLVPYYVGATLTPKRLRTALAAAGFELQELGAIVHFPRAAGVLVGKRLEQRGSALAQERFVATLWRAERLGAWPTRFVTGHFLAVRARRAPR